MVKFCSVLTIDVDETISHFILTQSFIYSVQKLAMLYVKIASTGPLKQKSTLQSLKVNFSIEETLLLLLHLEGKIPQY